MTKNKLERQYRESLVIYDLLRKTANINVLKENLLSLQLEKDEVPFFLDLMCVLEQKGRRRTLQPVIETYVPAAESAYKNMLTNTVRKPKKQDIFMYELGKLHSVSNHIQKNFLPAVSIDLKQTRLMNRAPDAYLMKKSLRKLRFLKLKFIVTQRIARNQARN
ncbi:hypothetical protein [Enterococcus innesii]|uniref:hypothetical protein n=1 Tax=Enterococcus innesii TaxID=2839759 RepID=UPI002DC01C20|nr:hypothetical protein [Enterococcus innesii]MEB5953213.1 hypothetical protein [Enterococcus innesii]